jgi:hypothetical protein
MADQSKRLMTLFASPTRAGGTYYSGTAREGITIEPGSRISLVKSSKVASNGSEIWSLLVDPPGARDQNRVHDQRGDVDLSNVRPSQRGFDDSEIPF